MPLVFTDRSSSYTTTNATSYATGTSFTPAAGSLMVCLLFASSTDVSEAQPTGVSGNGVTYSQHATTIFVSGVCSGSVWAGIAPASPTNDVVTASGWGTARTGIGMAVFEITGADTTGGTGLSAIQTLNTATPGAGTSGSVTMSGPVRPGNLCCGFADHTAAENITATGTNSLGSTGNYATPNRGAGSLFQATTYGNVSASWTTSAVSRFFGAEIKVLIPTVASEWEITTLTESPWSDGPFMFFEDRPMAPVAPPAVVITPQRTIIGVGT